VVRRRGEVGEFERQSSKLVPLPGEGERDLIVEEEEDGGEVDAEGTAVVRIGWRLGFDKADFAADDMSGAKVNRSSNSKKKQKSLDDVSLERAGRT
jgi:hypothetical protein